MINGGSAIQWAMNLLGHGHADIPEVDRLLEAAPPGAEGLRFWPFLAGGPNVDGLSQMRGRLSGITLTHTAPHLIRAVVEGLACELLRHVGLLVGAGISVKRITMCGGAASGRNAPQIIADVTGLPIHCVDTSDVSALGAAMLARALAAEGVRLDELARQWTPVRRVLTPRECAVYEDLREEYSSIFAESAFRPP
jgi:xylulokinase